MTCKRNAFVFLANCAMPRAVEYLLSVYDQIPSLDELMQLAFIELIRKDCMGETPNRVSIMSIYRDFAGLIWILTPKPKYIRCVFELLNASSHSVKYEAATTLTTLTQNPAAIKGAVPLSQHKKNRRTKILSYNSRCLWLRGLGR